MEPVSGALPHKRTKNDVRHAVDLLWIHRIRRENEVLHNEMKSLREAFEAQHEEHVSLEDVGRKAKAAAEEATASVRTVLSSQASLRSEAEKAKQERLEVKDQHEAMEARLADQEDSTAQLRNNFAKLQEECLRSQRGSAAHRSETDSAIADLGSKLNAKADNQAIHELRQNFKESIAATERRSVSRVEDSVEDVAPRAAAKSRTKSVNGLETTAELIDVSQKNIHFEPNCGLEQSTNRGRGPREQASEVMLTFKPGYGPREATASEDIDLDQNVTLMSYAGNLTRTIAEDAGVSTLDLEAPRQGFTRAELDGLRQGRFQSWETYLHRGQALLAKMPRREESHVVERFVNGMYSEAQRQQCYQCLDLNGWTWDSVASFGFSSTPCVPMQLGVLTYTTAPQPSRQVAHEPDARPIQTRLAGRALENHQRVLIDSVDNMLARPGVDKEGPQPRRSQRIEVQRNVSPGPAAGANTHSQIKGRKPNVSKTQVSSRTTKAQSGAISNHRPRDGQTGRFLPSQAEPPTQQSTTDSALRRSKPHKANSKAKTTIKKIEKVAKPKQQLLPSVMAAPKLPRKQFVPSQKSSVARTKIRVAEHDRSANKQPLTQRSNSAPGTPVNRTPPGIVVTSDSLQMAKDGQKKKATSINDDASILDFAHSPRITGADRKRKASDIFNDEAHDGPRKSDDVELPVMPLYFGKPVVESHKRKTKKRRLPLPPPPPIPILPTSED